MKDDVKCQDCHNSLNVDKLTAKNVRLGNIAICNVNGSIYGGEIKMMSMRGCNIYDRVDRRTKFTKWANIIDIIKPEERGGYDG